MSGKPSGANNRPGGGSNNTGERSVRQAENAVHREAVNDRLDAFEASVAENGGRLEKIEDSTAENGGGGSKRLRTCSGTFRICWMTSKPTKTLTSRSVTRGSITVRLPPAVACRTSYG